MIQGKKVLAIIPARGGSKGLPRKNILPIAGKPLIVWSIDTAKESQYIDRCIVSTDDKVIAILAKKYGAEVPFIRPYELAQDNSPTLPVLQHTLRYLEEKENYKPYIIFLLEPTAPLRDVSEVDNAIQMLVDDPDADSIRGVIESFQTPYKMWKIEEKYLIPLMEGEGATHCAPRQSLKKAYWQNGYIFAYKYDTIMKKNSIVGDKILPYIMSPEKNIDIDTKDDLERMEYILSKQ